MNSQEKRVKLIETQRRTMATRGWGWKKWGMLVKVYELAVKRWLNSGDLTCSMVTIFNYCCWSVTQSYPTVCICLNCSIAGFPVLYYLPEFVQTCAHTVFNNTDYTFEIRLGEQILCVFTKKLKKAIIWGHGCVNLIVIIISQWLLSMRKCSISLIIREMQIKTTISSYLLEWL